MGRLNPQKNHRLLLDAFAAAAIPGAHLLIAGEGDLRPELEARSAALGIATTVHFLGVRADVPRLFGAADALVMPSSWEGNPLVVMEAMAAGLPVVATRVGCVPELVSPDTGKLTEPGDRDGLAMAMTAMAGDLVRARRLGRAATLIANERFSSEAMARAYEALYRSRRKEQATS